MSLVAIVFYIISNLPMLLGMLQQIIAFFHGIPHADRQAMLHQLHEAAKSGGEQAVQAIINKKPTDSVVSGPMDVKEV